MRLVHYLCIRISLYFRFWILLNITYMYVITSEFSHPICIVGILCTYASCIDDVDNTHV